MKFEFNEMTKIEENIERMVTEALEERVLKHFDVTQVEDLTEEQVNEMMEWKDEYVSEGSPIVWAFENIYSDWENA